MSTRRNLTGRPLAVILLAWLAGVTGGREFLHNHHNPLETRSDCPACRLTSTVGIAAQDISQALIDHFSLVPLGSPADPPDAPIAPDPGSVRRAGIVLQQEIHHVRRRSSSWRAPRPRRPPFRPSCPRGCLLPAIAAFFVLLPAFVFAQPSESPAPDGRSIEGVVRDQTGLVLPGATVLLLPTRVEAVTDGDGR